MCFVECNKRHCKIYSAENNIIQVGIFKCRLTI